MADGDGTARSSSFGAAAQAYHRYRPAPPSAALRWVLGEDRPGRRVLDLAAGTGLVTGVLLDLGHDVVAVEPDPRMRAVLAGAHPSVAVHDGAAEAVPLPDADVDAVVVGSAWHWFDPERAVGEIARVLRPGGHLGVLGTVPDRGVDWVATLYERDRPATGEGYPRATDAEVVLPPALFGPVEQAEFTVTRPVTHEEVRALFATFSTHLVAGAAERAARDAAVLDALSARFTGSDTVPLPLRSSCRRATRVVG